MENKKRAVVLGFLSWLIPFVASIPFYSKDGKLLIPFDLFQTIMSVTGVLSGMILLIFYFKKVKKNYLRDGIAIGVMWYFINILFDMLILVPMSKMPLQTYFNEIGFEYLSIFIMATGVGYLLQKKLTTK